MEMKIKIKTAITSKSMCSSNNRCKVLSTRRLSMKRNSCMRSKRCNTNNNSNISTYQHFRAFATHSSRKSAYAVLSQVSRSRAHVHTHTNFDCFDCCDIYMYRYERCSSHSHSHNNRIAAATATTNNVTYHLHAMLTGTLKSSNLWQLTNELPYPNIS